jgi:hypothetical protein
MTRFLAFFCGLCPACAASRLWPRSVIRRAVAAYERFCPFCRAWRKLSDAEGGEEAGSKLLDGVVLMLWAIAVLGGGAALVYFV